MAKRTLDGLHVGGGVAVDFLLLDEADFATAPGAAYTPPERGQFRVVAARTIQLLQDAAGVVRTTQTTAATVRLPSGVTATNDAGDGRSFLIENNGTGTITIEDNTGAAIGNPINPTWDVWVVHLVNNTWRVALERSVEQRFSFASGAWAAGTANEITITRTTTPGAGEIGPTGFALANTYLVQVYDTDGANAELIDLDVEIDPTSGDITMFIAGPGKAFGGEVIVIGDI